MTGPRRRATGVVAVSGSLTVPRAISDAGLRRDLPAGCDGGQGDHLHRVVAEANPLEGDAVDGAMVFTDAAVRAAVVVDQDLAGLSAEFLPEHGVADLDEAAARGIAVFTSDNHVQRFSGQTSSQAPQRMQVDSSTWWTVSHWKQRSAAVIACSSFHGSSTGVMSIRFSAGRMGGSSRR